MTTRRFDDRSPLLDAALDAIVSVDQEGRIVAFNRAAEDMFGLPRDEALGRLLVETIIPVSFRASHSAGFRRYLATGEAHVLGKRIQISALRADGAEFPVELAITHVPHVDPPLFTGFFRDLTDQRRTERRTTAQYRVSEVLAGAATLEAAAPLLLEVLSEAFDAVFAALWRVEDRRLQCVGVHCRGGAAAFSALSETLTFTPGVGLPGRIWQTGVPHWVENVLDDGNFPRAAAARSDGLHAGFGFPVRLDGDALAVFEFFSTRILERDDDLVQVFHGIGRQVGQFIVRKRAEDDRAMLLVQERQARLEAEQANRAKDEFVAMISHELRTPLNAILGWSSILTNPATKEPTRVRAIEAIERGARAQAQLIEDLLDISRMVRGVLTIACAPVDAAAVARAAVEMLQPAANDRGVSLHPEALDRPVALWADRARLHQIVLNLVSNAIKFTPSGGEVHLAVRERGQVVEIEVRDNGIGISPEFLPHLFERFRQGEAPPRSGQRGLGLGLAIVRHLAQLHGGTVRAESAGEGQGSTFTVVLPRDEAGS